MTINSYKSSWELIVQSAMLEDMDKPLTFDRSDSENNLCNPYGKASCLMLYLYSMELGDPPLYAELNRVCRFMDKRQLANLGPFI